MPFTPCHPAAVLPLLRSRRLVPSALVVGSVTPDLVYFVPVPLGRQQTHSLGAVVSLDLVLGLVFWLVWALVLARPGAALLGRRPVPSRRVTVVALLGSLVLGALTHVGWDGFTHPGDWGARRWPVLLEPVGPLPLYEWLQHASTLLGGALLLAWLLRRRAEHPSAPPSGPRTAAWLALAVLPAGAAGVRFLRPDGHAVVERAFAAVSLAGGVLGGTAVLLAASWWAGRLPRVQHARRRRRDDAQAQPLQDGPAVR